MKNVFSLILCLGIISLSSNGIGSVNIAGCWENSGRIIIINSGGSVEYREGDYIKVGKWQLLDDRLILRWNNGGSDTLKIIKQTSNVLIIKWNGFFEYTFDRTECEKYVGKCIKGNCTNGKGTWTFPHGQTYVGQFKDGEPVGQGTLTWPNGTQYAGQWVNGQLNGQGTETLPDGTKYIGQWKDGKRNGQGTETLPDGTKYVGQWEDSKMNGQVTVTWPDGGKYVGQFEDGEPVGHGTATWPDGRKILGQVENGEFTRESCYDKSGKQIECDF